jgi:hypothetical protein
VRDNATHHQGGLIVTRRQGINIVSTPCCGRLYSTSTYVSLNFSAFERWTDGHTVGSLIPPGEGLRRCSCGYYYLLSEAKQVTWVPDPPAQPAQRASLWESLQRVFARPSRIQRSHDLNEQDAGLPERARHVHDHQLENVIRISQGNVEVELVARRRYWRMLNEPYRQLYREYEKKPEGTPPVFTPSLIQIENMKSMIEINSRSKIIDWVEVAELYRQLGEFEASIKTLEGRITSLGDIGLEVYNCSKKSIAYPRNLANIDLVHPPI